MDLLRAFNDGIIEHSVHRDRDQFIKDIRNREPEILQLAATSCHQSSSSFFNSPSTGDHFARGSFNLCFFIQFPDNKKCVFRIPLRPYLAYSPILKLRSEMATMQYLMKNTTIPVPKVLAYTAEEGNDPLSTFSILEYIDGEILSPARFESLSTPEKDEFYKSLADLYIQLRRQEFPFIGRIDGGPETFEIRQKTASLQLNMQQLEGLDPFSIQATYHDEHGRLQSANSYVDMLLRIGYNALFNSRNAFDVGMGRDALYHHHLFYKHAKTWVDGTLDKGPFVLVHGDLHLSNLMLDKKRAIIAVLDWEWSRVVPVQFFEPPLWLSGRNTVQLAGHNSWQLYMMSEFEDFLSIVKSRETELFGKPMLSDEWAERTQNAGPLVANALENWTDIDWFAFRCLSHADSQATKESIDTYMDEDPIRGLVVAMKEQHHHAYSQELETVLDTERSKKEQGFLAPLSQALSFHQALPGMSILGMSVAVSIGLSFIWIRAWSSHNH